MKTRLTTAAREVTLSFMVQQMTMRMDEHSSFGMRTEATIQATNMILRVKYPESDMVVLRKYQSTRVDQCLKFCSVETQRVFGLDFRNFGALDRLADIPRGRGCYSEDIYGCDSAFETLADGWNRAVDRRTKTIDERQREYFGFLQACKYIEDVEEVLPLPEEVRGKLGAPSRALAAMNPDLIQGIRAEFTHNPQLVLSAATH